MGDLDLDPPPATFLEIGHQRIGSITDWRSRLTLVGSVRYFLRLFLVGLFPSDDAAPPIQRTTRKRIPTRILLDLAEDGWIVETGGSDSRYLRARLARRNDIRKRADCYACMSWRPSLIGVKGARRQPVDRLHHFSHSEAKHHSLRRQKASRARPVL